VTEKPAPELATTVDVALADYAIAVTPRSVSAGNVTLSVVNEDSAPHNVVLVATDRTPETLPTIAIRVDELSAEIEVLGRTPTLRHDDSTTVTASLEPGSYVLVCTVPHHYTREMMVTTLSVA